MRINFLNNNNNNNNFLTNKKVLKRVKAKAVAKVQSQLKNNFAKK